MMTAKIITIREALPERRMILPISRTPTSPAKRFRMPYVMAYCRLIAPAAAKLRVAALLEKSTIRPEVAAPTRGCTLKDANRGPAGSKWALIRNVSRAVCRGQYHLCSLSPCNGICRGAAGSTVQANATHVGRAHAVYGA